jgi:crotonobetainyl-CoA:carnitine CoA-transferase CaiB-like acyl-CoA transferase
MTVKPAEALAGLWQDLNLPQDVLASIALTGSDPVLPSSLRVGTAAQVTIGAVALAAAELHRRRTSVKQQVSIDMRNAALEFRSDRYTRIAGGPAPELWDPLAGLYRCGDGRWVRLHTNFPHHRAGVLRLLACEPEKAAVANALSGWDAEKFEDAAAHAGLVVAMARTPAQWDSQPHGKAVPTLPLVALERIGEAPVEPLTPGARPLAGVRVLELARVLAGPICGRALAAHGADVLRVIAPYLPTFEAGDMDTGQGKLSAHVDLDTAEGVQTLRRLLADADVFVQSFRPGTLARRGFGPEEAAKLRPGIVYVSLSAYGHAGPWADRRGFDSLVQTTSGLNFAEAEAAGDDTPRALPCQALDHGAAYLLALGAIAGLLRRAEEGGSWLVRVSLVRTGLWLRSLGRVGDGFACPDPKFEDSGDRIEEVPSGYGGRLAAVRHAAQLSATPAQWTRPSMPFGSHPPEWPAR